MASSNTAIFSQLAAQEGVAALISTEPILPIMDKSIAKDFEQKKYQSGDTVDIRLEDQPMMPIQSNVIQLDPVLQRKIPVQVLQYNDGVPLPGVEEQYFLGGRERVRETIFKPRMKTLAVQAAILCYNELATCMNAFGTAGTDLTSATLWAPGKAVLNDQLALDSEGLYAIMSNQTWAATAADLSTRFNPTRESATAYMDGIVKEAMGFNFFATSNIPNQVNGSAAGNGTSGMKLSANSVDGDTSFAVSGGTATGTLKKGQLIYLSDGLAVQPQTKKNLSTKRYFTVAADVTLNGSGAGTITITQPVYGPLSPKIQNISVLPTSASSFVGVFGAVSTTYEQAIVMRKKAAAFISLPLPDMANFETSNADYDGVEIKGTVFSDATNFINMVRWDMLVAAKIRQNFHVARAFTRVVS